MCQGVTQEGAFKSAYTRLFVAQRHKEYKHFVDIPQAVDKQPAALTKAALEATVGAPLYPGIEMSWNAQISESYQLDKPFTIGKDVQPGHLTKYLSFPWQSDFCECRSFWYVQSISGLR